MCLINASQSGDGFGFYYHVNVISSIADYDMPYRIGGLKCLQSYVDLLLLIADGDKLYHIGDI